MAKSKTEANHVAQLEKAVQIIRHDLDQISPADLLKLREDLYEFCYETNIGPAPQGMMQRIPLENFRMEEFLDQIKRQRKMIPDDAVREIVESLKRTITGIATTPRGFSIDAEITADAEMIPKLILSAPDKSSPLRLTWNFPPRVAARLALVIHFYGSGLTANRIRICPLEGCGNIFVLKSYAREDREHYCSVNCARNAATRRYREGLKAKAKKKPKRRRK